MRDIKTKLVILLGVVLSIVVLYGFLYLEHEWEIGLLLVALPVAILVLKRTNMLSEYQQAARAMPKLTLSSFIVGVLVLIILLRDEHFALLMLTTVMLYVTVSLGLTIQFGFAGLVNFAAIAFFGIGAYSMAVLNHHFNALPDLLIILLSGLASAFLGALLILPILRTRGHYAALITIAFGILLRTFLEVNDVFGGPQGLKVDGLEILGWNFSNSFPSLLGGGSFYMAYAITALLLAAVAYLFTRLIEASWFGLNMDSVRLDEVASASFGINGPRWKIIAFMLGNFFAGLAGAIYAAMSGFIAPASFNFADSLLLVSIVLLGGIGNAVAVIPAALLIVVLPEKFQVIQEYRLLLFGIVVILILRFRPSGLLPRGLRQYFPGSST
ncbi:MAG: branched-chain amino acid ABC transporter permease [Burkholderiales bacterium]|nr:branched-chain amino acid ABC transporter permease [Burkholderiales bacterium]